MIEEAFKTPTCQWCKGPMIKNARGGLFCAGRCDDPELEGERFALGTWRTA